jgi:hypothetical protein
MASSPLWVIRDWVEPATKRDHVRYAPKADKSPHRSEMTRWATSGLPTASRFAFVQPRGREMSGGPGIGPPAQFGRTNGSFSPGS